MCKKKIVFSVFFGLMIHPYVVLLLSCLIYISVTNGSYNDSFYFYKLFFNIINLFIHFIFVNIIIWISINNSSAFSVLIYKNMLWSHIYITLGHLVLIHWPVSYLHITYTLYKTTLSDNINDVMIKFCTLILI